LPRPEELTVGAPAPRPGGGLAGAARGEVGALPRGATFGALPRGATVGALPRGATVGLPRQPTGGVARRGDVAGLEGDGRSKPPAAPR